MSHINDLLRRFSLVVIAGLLATGNACTQTAPIRLTAVLRRDGRVQVLELDFIYLWICGAVAELTTVAVPEYLSKPMKETPR